MRWLLRLTCAVLVTSAGPLATHSATGEPGRVCGRVQDPALNEISGVVAGRRNPGILWVHNDSGTAPEIHALTLEGRHRATFVVRGARATDWEDIAVGPGPEPNRPYLYLADIGDNRAVRTSITVYRVPEPEVPEGPADTLRMTQPCEALSLVYPDGPHDAETLLADPCSGDLLVVTKRDLFSRVYRAPAPLSPTRPLRLILVTLLPWGLATGGDVSPDGHRVVIRGPDRAMLWSRTDREPLWANLRNPGRALALRPEVQGEAVCFAADGRSVLTLSEGRGTPIHRYDLYPPLPGGSGAPGSNSP